MLDHRRKPATTSADLWAGVLTFLIWLLYCSPFFSELLRSGFQVPISLAHGETASLSVYGKWWIFRPHQFLRDGFSGDFPTFYNYGAELLINAAAALVRLPPMVVQAVIFGPLFAALFFLVNYLSLKAILNSRWTALLAALILSLAGSSQIGKLLDPSAERALSMLIHVPYHTIPFANGQSLGWLLYLPSLVLLHRAYENFTVRRAIAFGLVFGSLFHIHTLTFLNLALIQVAYLGTVQVRRNAHRWPPQVKKWALPYALLLLGIWSAFHGSVNNSLIAGAAALVLLGSLLCDRSRKFYFWGYGTALLVAAPYLVLMLRNSESMLGSGYNPLAVDAFGLFKFYSIYFVAAFLGWRMLSRSTKTPEASAFILIFFWTNLFLAENHLWGWLNHSYRYSINLIFPVAILAAIGIREAWNSSAPLPKWTARFSMLWIGLILAGNAFVFARGFHLYANYDFGTPEDADFFAQVRTQTDEDLLLLNPAEFNYPDGVVQSAKLINYSRSRGFVPDYRYLVSRERYLNRMALFCFLFPDFPYLEPHYDIRACEKLYEPPFRFRNPRLTTSILPVYSIGFAASLSDPFTASLRKARRDYGWGTLAEAPPRILLRTDAEPLPGLARFGAKLLLDHRLRVPFRVDRKGQFRILAGGRSLRGRVAKVEIDGKELRTDYKTEHWFTAPAELTSGNHLLDFQLTAPVSRSSAHLDFLFFLNAIPEEDWDRWIGPNPVK